MNAHTPGPWHLDEKTAAESFYDDVNILQNCGLAVAVAVQNNNAPTQEVVANALLIAASPDLLAALQALSTLANAICVKMSPAESEAMQKAWEKADQAIAKATGTDQPCPHNSGWRFDAVIPTVRYCVKCGVGEGQA